MIINNIDYSLLDLKGHDCHSSLFLQKNKDNEFLSKLGLFYRDFLDSNDTLTVHTSGSTGKPKNITVKKEHMKNSAYATLKYLNLKAGDCALLCMPVDFIAGKMMALRALLGNLKLTCITPCKDPLKDLSSDTIIDFIAITTMQALSILENEHSASILSRCKNILIGGGPIDNNLKLRLKDFKGSIYQSYAMTETLSHIALLDIKNNDDYYTLFDGIKLSLSEHKTAIIHAPMLCDNDIYTNDLIDIIDDRHFKVLGRIDNVINTGGIKVLIEDLEKFFTGKISCNFAFSKAKHELYGEQIILVIEGNETKICDKDKSMIQDIINNMPRYYVPKHIIYVDKIPLTKTYKVSRKELETLVSNLI